MAGATRSMEIPRRLLDQYFQTTPYPYTKHHLDSFNQFLQGDIPAIVRAANPIIVLKDLVPGTTNLYDYKVEIFMGGEDGSAIMLGTPTIQHQSGEDVRLMFPNEARLRNLTYSAGLYCDILVRVTFGRPAEGAPAVKETTIRQFPLAQLPIMLHSKGCLLNNKPKEFLQAVGECPYDQGGYFIIGGSEKVLITSQEQAFNTLYTQNQEADPQVATYSSISCLSPETRQVRRVTFGIIRKSEALHVGLPFVRKTIPVCILFRALGIESDEEIARLIYADLDSDEAKLMEPFLVACFTDSNPILDTYSAIQYIKTLTKGFSEAHVLDILQNQTFIHVPDTPGARAAYLGDCVRKIYRVYTGLDSKTDRDDTRNQRCLTSGFLNQMLFQDVYKNYVKLVSRAVDEAYNYNKQVYKGESFMNIFAESNVAEIFKNPMKKMDIMTTGIMRGFRGKWGSGGGEDKAGVLQALSRLSYIDFMSHCRRVVLEFDTGMKLTGPRQLHTSQYGYFCTNETPGGASIGITKNLSVLGTISIATPTKAFMTWLLTRKFMMTVEETKGKIRAMAVPIFINNGIVGYTLDAQAFVQVMKLLKWTGCLSASVGVAFFIQDRRILLNFDEGRPGRPLLHMAPWGPDKYPKERLAADGTTWRDMVMGSLPQTQRHGLSWVGFVDPLAEKDTPSLKEYIDYLTPYSGLIEYVDPYEQNETLIANFMEQVVETTSHVEIHPSIIMSAITTLIPFSNYNQSPRNQLGDSQSKQGISLYATNWQMRYDNQASILTNGAPPLCRTLFYDYLGQGKLSYGNNIVLAMGMFQGYNQDDGIVFNLDAFQRGLFNTVHYRSYNVREEDDEMAKTRSRIANPRSVPGWTSLKAGMDYSQLDESGIVKVGSFVDENTVLVARSMELPNGTLVDASEAAQVWTHGRVESVVLMVNNKGLRTVKIRVVEYRAPELGDKFSNRHGQKGTIGMMFRAHDLPRTRNGIVPDMMMNTHAIPSRMTIGMIMEMMAGKVAANLGAIADGTPFTSDGQITKQMGAALDQLGFERYGNEILYDGTTGKQLNCAIFIAPVFTMRLKHMVEDKWNARGKGRREQRTHQPTGGRGAQGGLRIGEMERDAVVGHGISEFVRESFMLRSDGVQFRVCKGCGTIPIENPKTGLFVCPLCTGPVYKSYIGSSSSDLQLVPPVRKTLVEPVTVEMPYAFKLLQQEMETYMNISMRILTEKDLISLKGVSKDDLPELSEGAPGPRGGAVAVLPERVLPETAVPEYREQADEVVEADPDLLAKLKAGTDEEAPATTAEGAVDGLPLAPNGAQAIQMAAGAVAAAAAAAPAIQGTLVNTAEGQMFQPAPTNITVVPPARTIQVTGAPEDVDGFETLEGEGGAAGAAAPATATGFGAGGGAVANGMAANSSVPTFQQVMGANGQPQIVQTSAAIPAVLPTAYATPAGFGATMGYPMVAGAPVGMNVGNVPQVYAATVPPPAQIYTTGIPGAPPTIAVQTDAGTMGAYANGANLVNRGPRPARAITTRRNRGPGNSFGAPVAEEGQGSDVRVTVNKLG